MKRTDMLGNKFVCECRREHELAIREFVYRDGAIDSLGSIVERCSDKTLQSLCVVADTRTDKIAGQRAQQVLRDHGFNVHPILLPDREGKTPACDEWYFDLLLQKLQQANPDAVVAAGSGVVNDLCKWTSFELTVPYFVVATAASMNGYSAANVAANVQCVKTLVRAKPPLAVLAEPAIIENAPWEMTASGFGDSLAKSQSNADWLMNHLLFGEYYCPFCTRLLSEIEPLFLNDPGALLRREPQAIRGLFEALFWAGVAMTLVGTSAPASGGEHLLSHTLDMIASANATTHDLHGRQVGIGVIISAALYEKVLEIEEPKFTELPDTINEKFWNDPVLIESVQQQWNAKQPFLKQARETLSNTNNWRQLRDALKTTVRKPQQIKAWLEQANAAHRASDIGIDIDQLKQTARNMHQMRSRFNILDLAWLTGILPDAVDEIADKWL